MNSKIKLVIPVALVAATAVFAGFSLTADNRAVRGGAEPAVQTTPTNAEHTPQLGSPAPATAIKQVMDKPQVESGQKIQAAGITGAIDDTRAESENGDESAPASTIAGNNVGVTVEEDFVDSGTGYSEAQEDNSVIHISNVGDRIVVTRSYDSLPTFTQNNGSNSASNNPPPGPGYSESSNTVPTVSPPPRAGEPVGTTPNPVTTDPAVNSTPDRYTPENDENVWVTANCPAQLPQGSSADDAQTMATSYGCEYLRYCRPLNDGSQEVYCWWGFWRGPAGAG